LTLVLEVHEAHEWSTRRLSMKGTVATQQAPTKYCRQASAPLWRPQRIFVTNQYIAGEFCRATIDCG
jgi:hypothetical protein